MDIGERINQLRKAKGYTLQQVGDIVGVGKSTVRRWESGEIENMRRDKIKLLADALGVSVDYLLGYTDEQIDNALARRTVHIGISEDEYKLIESFRSASKGVKEAVCKLLDI